MSVCQQHNLYDAIIYIYNNAMLDYITPVEKLLRLLASTREHSDEMVRLGNKLLVYISQCLAGRAYPHGDIPRERVKQAKYDVYSTITILNARNSDAEESISYPHLHTLLMFDTQVKRFLIKREVQVLFTSSCFQGFLNVLSIAFEEDEFSSEVGQCQKQRLVDILLHVMLAESDVSPFSGHQVGYLASFLARQLARADNTVLVSRDVFTRVLAILTRNQGPGGQREERQQAVLDIIHADTQTGWTHFDLSDLEEKCLSAGFYQVLEKLYERSGRQDEIIDCYLLDIQRRTRVFSWLARARVSVQTLLEKMSALMEIDVIKFTDVVLKYSEENNLLCNVLEQLRDEEETLYSVLHHVMSLSHPLVSRDMHSRHLQLMCQFEPASVPQYLASADNHEYYDISEALQLCTDHGLLEARVYLLERQSRVSEAFELLMSSLKPKLRSIDNENIGVLNQNVTNIIELCQRSSDKVISDEIEDMWCSLLQVTVQPLSELEDADLISSWRLTVRTVVSSMLGHVDNARVVSIIVSEPGFTKSGNWSDVKEVMGDILDMARYEERLLASTLATLRAEIAEMSGRLVRQRQRGVSRARVIWDTQVTQVTQVTQDTQVTQNTQETTLDTQGRPSEDTERLRRARQFLALYRRDTDLAPGSVLKSDKFQLVLRPEHQ